VEQRRAADHTAGTPGVSVFVCGQASRPWRRELGALAWAALEELALTANRDSRGWASPAGIRAIATGIGTTHTAVLHAIAALTRAGLVALGPLIDQPGQCRCGYRLYLPDGITLDNRPGKEGAPQSLTARSPNGRDAGAPGSDAHPQEGHDEHRWPTDQADKPIDPFDVPSSREQQ
jgi:hypothetical protein